MHHSRCRTGAERRRDEPSPLLVVAAAAAVAVDAADDDIRRVSLRGCDLSKAYPLPTRHTHTHTEIEIHIYCVCVCIHSSCSTCRATSSWSPSSGNDFGSSCARFASLPPFSFLVTFYVFPSPLAARHMPHTCHTGPPPTPLPIPSSSSSLARLPTAGSSCDSSGRAHLVSLLLCSAITYIQGTTYKIILYINNEKRVHRSHNLPSR